MKKKTLLGLSVILMAGIFTSCDLTYFDNEIEDFTWKGGVHAPLGHVTYTLSELFEELEISQLDEDVDGNFSFTHTESFNTKDNASGDLVDIAINNETITSEVSSPVTTSDISPASFPVILPDPLPAPLSGGKSDSNQVVYDLGLSQDLTGATFNSGTMVITFTSTFQAANATLTMNIPSFTKISDDSEYVDVITLNGAESQALTINLDEYNANFTHNGTAFNTTVNTVVLNMGAVFTFIPGQELTENDKISYSAVLSNAGTDVVHGDFKDESFSTTNDEISFDFFSDFGDGAISFADASMKLDITNGFGFPIGINVSGIQADNGVDTPLSLTYSGEQTDDNNVTTTPDAENTIIIDGISVLNETPTAADPRTLDKDNSNINELLSMKPTSFIMSISGELNPESVVGTPNENFFASINEGVQVEVTVEAPLTVKFTNVKISQDDIELDLGEDLDELNEISLKVSTINEIPLSGTINLTFKENGTELGLNKSIPAFQAAPTDSNGKSNGSMPSSTTLTFNSNEMELLKQATDIGLDITFDSGTDTVKLNGEDSIKLILSAVIDAEISGDDEEEENN